MAGARPRPKRARRGEGGDGGVERRRISDVHQGVMNSGIPGQQLDQSVGLFHLTVDDFFDAQDGDFVGGRHGV